MFARTESETIIRDQASVWATLLDSGDLSETQRRDFHGWLEDPRHERELARQQTLLFLAQDIGSEDKASLGRTVSDSEDQFNALRRLLAQPLWISGVAAAAAATVVIGGWFGVRPVREFFTHSYTTEVGEMRTVTLKDGTIAHLNTQSQLAWVGTGTDRHVVLLQGEVFFEVVHDATRPFRITVDHSEIRDIGTQFDVYRKSSGSVVVTVISGQVAVQEIGPGGAQPPWAERQLKANEQIEYTPSSLIADVHSTVAPKAVRWREGLLETEGQAFSTVVGELNRYSNKQILVPDLPASLQNINIGGTLNVHDVPAALKRIQKLGHIVMTDTPNAYILSYEADPPVMKQPNAVGRP
ncbi:MAG: fec operon regulator FecR [Gammaproteobacteria bacterium]|jgi:transmembrane sensor|nr:fec operon regulator FecR [Gammaproteobacteria bacterium]